MDKADYLKGVWELYAAEIEGEGLAADGSSWQPIQSKNTSSASSCSLSRGEGQIASPTRSLRH